MADSTSVPVARKPRPDFPLFPHQRGHWCKKIRGKTHYFGKIEGDPHGDAALNLWLDQKEALLAGRKPRSKDEHGLALKDLCNRFLTAKTHQQSAGEITARTFAEYKQTTDRLMALFGDRLVVDLQSDDFEQLRAHIAKAYGPVALGNAIQRTRSVFKYAYDAGLIEAPIRFGPMFKRPSQKTLRVARAKAGTKMFTPQEVKLLLANAGPQLKAMILLALNAGFGNADCGTLPIEAIDLKAGWIVYPRPKTGIERRCPLWPETVKAIKAVLAKRKPPKADEHQALLFVTKRGGTFAKDTPDNPVAKEFAKLVKAAGVEQYGRGFYALRHTFRTVADETKDFPACDLIMGHTDPSMAARYREKVDDDRLKTVVAHVRKWLFNKRKDG